MPISLRCFFEAHHPGPQGMRVHARAGFENGEARGSQIEPPRQIEDGFGTGFEMLVVRYDQAIPAIWLISPAASGLDVALAHHPFYPTRFGWPSFDAPVDTRRQGRQRNARPSQGRQRVREGRTARRAYFSWPSACESLRHGPEGRKQRRPGHRKGGRERPPWETCGCF